MEVVELEGLTNVRGLGGIPVGDGRLVKHRLFYRSDNLSLITEADKRRIKDVMGVRCVIDLRVGWEREAKPDTDIEGVLNLHIPFYDKEKVGIEYTRSIEGSKVQGHDIVCDPDHFYRSMSNPLTARMMAKGLDTIFCYAEKGEATLQHCSGGKDRAGIMALLILTVLGASREDILEDYLATNVGRDKNIDAIYARFLRLMDGDEEKAWVVTENHRARPQNLLAFYESVDERYGGMEQFLDGTLGFDRKRRARLVELCTCPA